MHLIHKNRDFRKSPHIRLILSAWLGSILVLGTGYWVRDTRVLLLVLSMPAAVSRLGGNFWLNCGGFDEWYERHFFPFHIPFRSVGWSISERWACEYPWYMYVNVRNCVTLVINHSHDQQHFCHGLVLATRNRRSCSIYIHRAVWSVCTVGICASPCGNLLQSDNVWKITSSKLEHLWSGVTANRL